MQRPHLFHHWSREQRHAQAATDVFEQMKSSGVSPGVRSYTSLLQALSDDNSRRSKAMQREAAVRDGASTSASATAAAAASGAVQSRRRNGHQVPAAAAATAAVGAETAAAEASGGGDGGAGAAGGDGAAAAEQGWASRPAQMTPSDPAADNLFRVFLLFGEMKSQGVQPDRPG
jgi:Pentatricopeptide repeat domain